MYKVYFTDPFDQYQLPQAYDYDTLQESLEAVQTLRNNFMKFVTLVSELEGCTSKPGAKVLEAQEYLWTKRR